MENNPIKTLMNEHETIGLTEGIIQNLDKLWETDEEFYTQKVNNLLTFFSEYSDKYHHHKEEEVLFKELNDNPDFLLDDIITELEEHHESFRNTISEVREALDNNDFADVQSLLEQYINDLLDHIAIENDELFVTVELLFNESQLERMFFLFKDIDMELGEDRKIELVKSIAALK